MELQSPAVLFWLAPLLGAIILLYLLKMRRRDVRVPAAFLWPRVTADVRANAPIQRLRISALLLIQLLAVALIVLALADPLKRTHGLNGRATVIVLDASASMAATDVSPSRFDSARSQIDALISSMQPGDQLALIEAGSSTRVVFALTGDKPRMHELLHSLDVTDAPNDMGEALRLAGALVGRRNEGRIIVYSDGAFAAPSDFSPGNAGLVYVPIGKTSHNVGITAFDSLSMPDGSVQLYAGLTNFDTAPMQGVLSYYIDGSLADAKSVTIPPGITIGQTIKIAGNSQRAEVRIDAPGDVLASDNRAVLYLHGAGTVRTLLITPGDLFLERALSLEPEVRLDVAPAVPSYQIAGSPGDGGYDLVVFDGVPPVKVKAPAVWSFGETSPELPVNDLGPALSPRVIAWNRDDPILKYVDLSSVLIQRARQVSLKPEGRVLVEGSNGPLVVRSEVGGRRFLYTAFTPLDSDLPLHVAFPILVGNAVSWLTGEGRVGSGGGITVRTGQTFTIAVPPGSPNLTLTKPNGERETLDASTGVVTIRSADQVGDYVISGGQGQTHIAANLLNESESDIRPRVELSLAGHAALVRKPTTVLAEVWRPVVLFVLCLLALEWWVFVRKS